MAHPTPFPIPLVSFASANGVDDGGALDFLPLPKEMATYQPPHLPEREQLAGHAGALGVLHAVCAACHAALRGEPVEPVPVDRLAQADLALLNQVLGEGEVSAQVLAAPGAKAAAQVQESVFAGVWRVLETADDGAVSDRIEVAAIPELLRRAAREDMAAGPGALSALPAGLVNVPTLLDELAEHRRHWRKGQPAEVINLSLLPVSAADIGALDEQLGTGRVLILSRGYGNCRITNTLRTNTWRVVYYNSQDKVILNTIEVTDLPEVALAAPEDLADSLERLTEVLQWVEPA